MDSDFFQPQDEECAQLLAPIANAVIGDVGAGHKSPPAAFVGDLILSLAQRGRADRSSGDREGNSYAEMWQLLPRGRRWRYVARRLEILRRNRRRAAGAYEKVLAKVATDVCRVMMKNADKHFADGHLDSGETLIAEAYFAETQEAHLEPDWPMKDFLVIITELARRAAVVDHLETWLDADLIARCLEKRWLADDFKPRQLQLVTKLGDDSEVLAGDLLSVRGITKKLKEEQIPKILPSEYATWHTGGVGRMYTLDKIINRSPSCYQHFDTRRPEAEHRLFILFAMDAEVAQIGWSRRDAEQDAQVARQEAQMHATRALAFSLLVHAAMRTPHENIKADVAWTERRGGKWSGSTFPLRIFNVSQTEHENWRNVAGMDALTPNFLHRGEIGAVTDFKHEVLIHRQSPQSLLARGLGGGRYHAACVAAFATPERIQDVLPAGSVTLPAFDHRYAARPLCQCGGRRRSRP